ncbi:MAG: hypothetical protein U0792_19765 [Gemmataceae bacterium]
MTMATPSMFSTCSPRGQGLLADWPVGDGKDTEPEVLKAHLDELFTTWLSLRALTGTPCFASVHWLA